MIKIKKICKKYEERINYFIVGVMTTFVNLFVYYICVFTFFDPKDPIKLQIANVISWICCVTFAYFANRSFVFKSKNKNQLKAAIKFYLSRISTLIIDMSTMFLLVTVFSFSDKISKILVQFIILLLNYLFSKFLVFTNKDKKKKVIFLSYNLDIGGIERAVLNYVKEIDKTKYEVYLMLEKKEGIYLDEVPKGVKIIDFNICSSKNIIYRKIKNAWKLFYFSIKYYNRFDFSACFATTRKSSAILAKRFSTNNALWFHGEYWYNEEEANKFLRYIRAEKYKKLVFVANKLKENYLLARPNTNQKLYVINNMIDYKSMIKMADKKINVKKDKVTLLNVGRHEESAKRLTILLKSVAKLLHEGYDFNLWLVGDGPDRKMYEEMVDELKITKNVKFFGKQKNVFPYYKLCDCVVLSSAMEGNPVVYLEAKVMNKPVISTNVSDAKIELDGYGIVTDLELNSYYKGLKSFLDKGLVVKKKFDPDKYNLEMLEKMYRLIDEG